MAYSLAKIDQLKTDLMGTRPTFDEMNLNKVDFAKEMEFALQAFQSNTYLLGMEASTVKNCLVNVALSGLTLSPVMKMAYLVPRKGKCCLDPSYMGLIKIITDTGSVKSIKAKPVYSNEPFDIEQGSNGYVKHGICKDGNKGKRIGAYSIAVLNDGTDHVEWMYEEQLMAIKARSESVKSGKASPWDTDEDEMVRKTVIKRHWKFLPKSDRALMASQAIAMDDEHNGIDFDKEKQELDAKKTDGTQDNATPTAPALATEEDFNIMFKLLEEECFTTMTNLHYLPAVLVSQLKSGLEKSQLSGKMEKSKAEEYIKLLEAEILYAKENPQPETPAE